MVVLPQLRGRLVHHLGLLITRLVGLAGLMMLVVGTAVGWGITGGGAGGAGTRTAAAVRDGAGGGGCR